MIAVGEDPQLSGLFPGRFYSLVTGKEMSAQFQTVACPDIRYTTPQDRQKFDIVQSIRTLTLLREQHPEKRRGGRLHFRTPAKWGKTCKEHPDWLRTSTSRDRRAEFWL